MSVSVCLKRRGTTCSYGNLTHARPHVQTDTHRSEDRRKSLGTHFCHNLSSFNDPFSLAFNAHLSRYPLSVSTAAPRGVFVCEVVCWCVCLRSAPEPLFVPQRLCAPFCFFVSLSSQSLWLPAISVTLNLVTLVTVHSPLPLLYAVSLHLSVHPHSLSLIKLLMGDSFLAPQPINRVSPPPVLGHFQTLETIYPEVLIVHLESITHLKSNLVNLFVYLKQGEAIWIIKYGNIYTLIL